MKTILISAMLLVANFLHADELHDACLKGDLEAAKKALAANPSTLNELSKIKLTPLMLAARTNAALVEFLISKGADVNAKGFMGGTALHSAAVKHHVESMIILLKHGADVNAQEEGKNTPALFVAGKFGERRKDALKVLIDNKADLTLADSEGTSIRRFARKDPELEKILKELGAKY